MRFRLAGVAVALVVVAAVVFLEAEVADVIASTSMEASERLPIALFVVALVVGDGTDNEDMVDSKDESVFGYDVDDSEVTAAAAPPAFISVAGAVAAAAAAAPCF